jgi:hypothetical protein
MDVEVLDVLKGTDHPGRMRIWGDNGAQCRPYVSAFPPGTEWIFAVSRSRTGGDPGGFAVSICGEHWARVEGNTAVGRLSAARPPGVNDVAERMPLAELRSRLQPR